MLWLHKINKPKCPGNALLMSLEAVQPQLQAGLNVSWLVMFHHYFISN